MILLLLAVLLTSASEVQRLLKDANPMEKELSNEDRDFASPLQEINPENDQNSLRAHRAEKTCGSSLYYCRWRRKWVRYCQMKPTILNQGIASENCPKISIANYKETENDKLCKLFEISKDVLAIVIHFAGTEGMEKFPKTCKKFEKLAPYIYQSLEQIPLAVRDVRNPAIFLADPDLDLLIFQYDPDLPAMFRKAIKPKRLCASIPFRLMNGEFIRDPNADPTLICGLQNKGGVSFCAFRAPSLDALNLDISGKKCVFSDVLKFPTREIPKIRNFDGRYNLREISKIRKVMHCLVSHPNQKEPNQFYLSCASKPELLGQIGGQAVLVCKLPRETRSTPLLSRYRGIKIEVFYEYIVESNKGVFHWSPSPTKHIFMNENVIAFCNPYSEFTGQFITLFSVFDGGAKRVELSQYYDEPKLTLPVIKSDEPGYAIIYWSENDVTIVTPEDNWNSDDDNLIDYFN